ncbi:hypothetical protein EKO27_g233 [Xylaria grammica]|uniref:MYND-type domain-containing protein n=1 Tax=Xylaria grammica TaxID=363999 RepID=A0A439DKK4_9PEZI|nr:hypothetical protein EKO27_g233 [Xylaria grammica]
MLTPAKININSFFYPIGITPAVSLTQSIPPNEAADVLLLGCGDVRNILFTRHIDDRKMDITCCDTQKGVIARNILLLSLAIDDEENRNYGRLWDVYYHIYIDQTVLDLIRSQANKLYALSATMGTWQQSKYGSRLSFCDSTTLLTARKVWSFYGTEKSDVVMKRQMASALERANYVRGHFGSNEWIYAAGFRSTIPAEYELLQGMSTLHENYWKYGRNDSSADARASANHPNPTFLVGEEKVNIYYNIDPLFGFHLATAYMPTPTDDPEFGKLGKLPQLERLVAVARQEFSQWMVSYRRYLSDTTIRFFIGDPVALAYTLHHKRVTTTNTAHWYRDRYSLQQLVLDALDYTSDTAPLDFDVIDTGNLCDYLGSLTLLTATSPLLRNRSSSVLFTEAVSKYGETYHEMLHNKLCGHVPTLTTLLSLFPVEYWTNTSSISLGDDNILKVSLDAESNNGTKNAQRQQILLRTCWKRPLYMVPSLGSSFESTSIKFDASQLARALYQVYVHMFQNEDYAQVFKSPDLAASGSLSLEWYHRASFAAFLRLVQSKVVVCDWDAAMRDLLTLIENKPNTPANVDRIHEFYTYLHILGIYSVDAFKSWYSREECLARSLQRLTPTRENWGDLRDWENVPPVVCVTLKIPREKLKVFTTIDGLKIETPVVYCVIKGSRSETSPTEHMFNACQLAFGDISTEGKRHTQSFRVLVAEDDAGWNGSSPLISAFYLPASLLLQPGETRVSFRIWGMVETAPNLGIGMDMKIYETTLGNADGVYITQHAPHQTRFPVAVSATPTIPPNSATAGASVTLSAGVDKETGHIVTFNGRLDITSNRLKRALNRGCNVSTSAVSPSGIAIRLGQTTPFILSFPVFILAGKRKLVVARRSCWVEAVVQVADGWEWMKYPLYMYPIHHREGKLINWNMPYLNLLKCPVIDTAQDKDLQHLIMCHLANSLSAREFVLEEQDALRLSAGERIRVLFKKSINLMFSHFHGSEIQKNHVLGLRNAGIGVPQMLTLVNNLRINLTDRTLLLDCAVVPLFTEEICGFEDFSRRLKYNPYITWVEVDDEELQLWRRTLPAYVERCRTWTHHPDCAYMRTGRIPLTIANNEPFLCKCGNGQFSPGFKIDIPDWEEVKKYAVRAAISPAFWAPFFDEVFNPDESRPNVTNAGGVSPTRECASCGRTRREDGGQLLNCGRCMKVKYCSRGCQRADWKLHKADCK